MPLNGEIHIGISLSCLRSSCKRRTVSARRPHSTTAHAHRRYRYRYRYLLAHLRPHSRIVDRLCRRAVRSLCGRAVVRSVFIETLYLSVCVCARTESRLQHLACRLSRNTAPLAPHQNMVIKPIDAWRVG